MVHVMHGASWRWCRPPGNINSWDHLRLTLSMGMSSSCNPPSSVLLLLVATAWSSNMSTALWRHPPKDASLSYWLWTLIDLPSLKSILRSPAPVSRASSRRLVSSAVIISCILRDVRSEKSFRDFVKECRTYGKSSNHARESARSAIWYVSLLRTTSYRFALRWWLKFETRWIRNHEISWSVLQLIGKIPNVFIRWSTIC